MNAGGKRLKHERGAERFAHRNQDHIFRHSPRTEGRRGDSLSDSFYIFGNHEHVKRFNILDFMTKNNELKSAIRKIHLTSVFIFAYISAGDNR
jgi:hypothetical protein